VSDLPPPPSPADAGDATWTASPKPLSGHHGSRHVARRWVPVAVGVVVVLAVVALAGVFLGEHRKNAQWQSRFDQAVATSSRWENEAEKYRDASATYQSDLQNLRTRVQIAVGDLNHPRFVVWNTSETLDASHYLFGSIPDTFSWTLTARSTRYPIKVLVMTSHDYACWYTNACPARWRYWGPSRQISAGWDAARGCAGYVFVITTTGPTTVIPKESIKRDPAARTTGACRA
jgi:hypothetical protein